jgi:hypothetical protein
MTANTPAATGGGSSTTSLRPKPAANAAVALADAGAIVTNRGIRADLCRTRVAVSPFLANMRILKGVFAA